jgi:hypothetical protein
MHMKININGNEASTLISEFLDVYQQADNLRDRVHDVTIHGRNYMGDLAGMDADRAERLAMIQKVEEVRQWALDCVLQIQEQTT